MKKNGITVVEIVVTCALLCVFLSSLHVLSIFTRKAEQRINSNTIAMYSLESMRNIIMVDLRSNINLSKINEKRYAKFIKEFPYPINISKDYLPALKKHIINISMHSPVRLKKNKRKTYIREILLNE